MTTSALSTGLLPDNPENTPAPSAGADNHYRRVLQLLLADKRSAETRRAYEHDLRAFFAHLTEGEATAPTPERLRDFLRLAPHEIAFRLAEYKMHMTEAGLSEATRNRRLSAVRSLLKFAFRLGMATTDGRGLVDSEKNRAYRDTRGVGLDKVRELIAAPGTDTLQGKRDTAILRLMLENALRRAEVCRLSVGDFVSAERVLHILGKGRGSQKEPISLTTKAARAIWEYVQAAGHGDDKEGPLFRNVAHHRKGGPGLTVDGLYFVIKQYGEKCGLKLSPHKLRHTAITLALNEGAMSVQDVQRLSRHADLNTVVLYNDRKEDRQGAVSQKLSKLF